MVRLGWQLTLHSGREAFTRLLLTTVAVAIGVAVLLGVFAEFHAFQANGNRSCWECTQGSPLPQRLPAHAVSCGTTARTSSGAGPSSGSTSPPWGRARRSRPASPGCPAPASTTPPPRWPRCCAPCRATSLATVSPARWPGRSAQAALSGPDELAVYVGYPPSSLAMVPGTSVVTAIQAGPGQEVFTPFFRYAFGVGVLAVLFPVLILIGTATRLAAARREERFAALRLVGATPRDVSVIASVDSVVSALAGAVLGIGLFLAIRPALAGASLTGTRYFAATVTPTAWEYLGLLVAVPAASALASLAALRRVRISPLGVSRRVAPPPPSAWRLVTLAAGVALFVAGMLATNKKSIGAPAYPGLLVVMIGLVIAGPWLTAAAARWCARVLNGASPLLAARRLADNPKAAFRAVRGLVLAVFLGTMIGALVPVVQSFEATPNAVALNQVLLDTFAQMSVSASGAELTPAGLTPRAGATLVSELRTVSGTTVYPLYSLPQVANPNYQGQYIGVIGCSVLRQLAVLGQCAAGAQAVQVNDNSLVYSDNPHNSTEAFASPANPAFTGSLATLPLQAVLVRVNDAATLERVRTFLAIQAPPDTSAGQGIAATPPRTYAEAVAIRSGRAQVIERLVYLAVALTMLVAGCSLAVALGGGLVDRKRPFTLLRVGGTPIRTLYRVVFLEAAVPLAAATVVAAALAYGMSILIVIRLAPPGTPVPLLGHVYYATMGAGLAIALIVIGVTLPLLKRMTGPDNARFE